MLIHEAKLTGPADIPHSNKIRGKYMRILYALYKYEIFSF